MRPFFTRGGWFGGGNQLVAVEGRAAFRFESVGRSVRGRGRHAHRNHPERDPARTRRDSGVTSRYDGPGKCVRMIRPPLPPPPPLPLTPLLAVPSHPSYQRSGVCTRYDPLSAPAIAISSMSRGTSHQFALIHRHRRPASRAPVLRNEVMRKIN